MAIKTLFETALDAVEKTDVEGIGILRYEPDGRTYRWVKSTSVTAVVNHQPLCYDDAEGTGSLSGLVTKVLEPGNDAWDMGLFAGCAMTAWTKPTTTDPQFAWIQVYGFHADADCLATGSKSDMVQGDIMAMQTGTGTDTAAFIRETAAGVAALYDAHVILLESSTVSGAEHTSLNVFIRAL